MIFATTIYCNFFDHCEKVQHPPNKVIKKIFRTLTKFNQLTMKAIVVIMTYSLLMIQGSCGPGSEPLVVSFVFLVTFINFNIKIVAKYSPYKAVYYTKIVITSGIIFFTIFQFLEYYRSGGIVSPLKLLFYISAIDFYGSCADLCRARLSNDDIEKYSKAENTTKVIGTSKFDRFIF